MCGIMNRKYILRIAAIACLLVMAIFLLVENYRMRFFFTPTDWGFSSDDRMTLYDARGRAYELFVSHIGPLYIVYERHQA
jgi:hypothetical protein